jgi:hypothetical protein
LRSIYEYPEINPYNDKSTGRVIGWWSGGVASAVACKLALDQWGDRVDLVFCDTGWEHPDTFEFMWDFENMFDVEIKSIRSLKYTDPEAVWRRFKGMNFAHGAPCSTHLKKGPRLLYQDTKEDFCQVFGFDYGAKEERRATNLLVNNPDINPVFPLIVNKLDREGLFTTLESWGLKRPKTYDHFLNNNCIGADDSPLGGCVQGGAGYWLKIKELYPKKYDYMANIEHGISIDKGVPVSMCRDQRKATKGNRLFLKPCPAFPDVETILAIRSRRPITTFECNGLCSTDEGEL